MRNIIWEVRGCQEIIFEGEKHVVSVPDEDADFFGLYTSEGPGPMMWFYDFPTREEAEEAGHKLENSFNGTGKPVS